MSCSVCAGYSSYKCPCCGGEQMMTCPDCEDGMEYYSFDIRTRKFTRVTALAYQILPYDEDDAEREGKRYCQGDIIPCSTCHGDGEIPKR